MLAASEKMKIRQQKEESGRNKKMKWVSYTSLPLSLSLSPLLYNINSSGLGSRPFSLLAEEILALQGELPKELDLIVCTYSHLYIAFFYHDMHNVIVYSLKKNFFEVIIIILTENMLKCTIHALLHILWSGNETSVGLGCYTYVHFPNNVCSVML